MNAMIPAKRYKVLHYLPRLQVCKIKTTTQDGQPVIRREGQSGERSSHDPYDRRAVEAVQFVQASDCWRCECGETWYFQHQGQKEVGRVERAEGHAYPGGGRAAVHCLCRRVGCQVPLNAFLYAFIYKYV